MKRTKLKRHSSNSISVLKKRADKVFSDYVRRSGDKCYTCGAKLPYEKRQAGHFISRTHNSTRYSLENVKIQCGPCNIWRHGNPHEFASRLLEELGPDKFHELIMKSRQTKQFTASELKEIIKIYEQGTT